MLCNTCKKQTTCVKICNKLENYLQREQSKEGYSSRHMRRKEVPADPAIIEFLDHDKYRSGYEKSGGGWRKKPNRMDDFD